MKRIVIMSRNTVESVKKWDRPTAIISITDPSKRGPYANAAKVVVDHYVVGMLRLFFHDRDPVRWPDLNDKIIPEMEAEGHIPPHWMTDEQGVSILDFWRSVDSAVDQLVVHCEAGISRSAGVAAALSALAGLEDGWIYTNHRPNAHVKATILRAARARMESPHA